MLLLGTSVKAGAEGFDLHPALAVDVNVRALQARLLLHAAA